MRLILAVGDNGEIGQAGGMPWGMSQAADLARFKAVTMGSVVVMGRRTFQSLDKPLPGRVSMVVGSTVDPIPGGLMVRSVEAALRILELQENPAYLIGGAQLVSHMIGQVDEVYLTVIEATFPQADTYFDRSWLSDFECVSTESFGSDIRNRYPYRFEIWRRNQ